MHSCRCYVLPELHKTFSSAAKTFRCWGCDDAKPRPQTHKVSPPRPSTFNHEVGVGVFEIVDSVGLALLNPECCLCGNHVRSSMDCEGIREPRFSIVTCMSTSFHTWLGRAGPAGRGLFAVIEEHTTGTYFVRLFPRMVSRSDLPLWKHQNKSEEWNDEVTCSRR